MCPLLLDRHSNDFTRFFDDASGERTKHEEISASAECIFSYFGYYPPKSTTFKLKKVLQP